MNCTPTCIKTCESCDTGLSKKQKLVFPILLASAVIIVSAFYFHLKK